MVPTQTLENFPPFGDNATKSQPDNAKYAAGFQPADVYPAEWVNWVWGKSSNGVTKLNAGVDMMEREINNVLGGADKTPDATKDNQLLQAIQKLISDAETRAKLAAHPIGSLYWSSDSTDPGTLFGGTWTRIKDKFILAAGDTYSNGGTGGAATVTLQTTQIPSHNHSFTGTAVTSGANSRGHTHSVTAAGSVSVTTNPTFTGSSHTHSYTPAGSVSITTNPTFTGSAVTSGSGGNWMFRIRRFSNSASSDTVISTSVYTNINVTTAGGSNVTGARIQWITNTDPEYTKVEHPGHTHSVTAAGTISGGAYKFTGTSASLSATQGGTISGGAYKFTGSAVTSGGESQDHTHSVTAAGTVGSTGGGGSHENMPPYLVKYCWERTA